MSTFYVTATSPRSACRSVAEFKNWIDAPTAAMNKENKSQVVYRITAELVYEVAKSSFLSHEADCSVENCGMNAISSLRISDDEWVGLCIEHSSMDTWPLRIDGRTLHEDENGDPYWEGEAS